MQCWNKTKWVKGKITNVGNYKFSKDQKDKIHGWVLRKTKATECSELGAYLLLGICPFPAVTPFSRLAFEIYQQCDGKLSNYGTYPTIKNLIVESFSVISDELNAIKAERIKQDG